MTGRMTVGRRLDSRTRGTERLSELDVSQPPPPPPLAEVQGLAGRCGDRIVGTRCPRCSWGASVFTLLFIVSFRSQLMVVAVFSQ
jgi:hypothetical protein